MNGNNRREEQEEGGAVATSRASRVLVSWFGLTLPALALVLCVGWAIAGMMAGDHPPVQSPSGSGVGGAVHRVQGRQAAGPDSGASVGRSGITPISGRKFAALKNATGQGVSGRARVSSGPKLLALLDSELGGQLAPRRMFHALTSDRIYHLEPSFGPRAMSDCWPTETEDCGMLVYSSTVLSGYFFGFYETTTCHVAQIGDDLHLEPGGPRQVCQISIGVTGVSSPPGGTMTITCQLYTTCSAGVLSGAIAGTEHTFTGVPRDENAYILTYPVNLVTVPDNMWVGFVVSGFTADWSNDGGPLYLGGPGPGPGSTQNRFSLRFTGTGCQYTNSCSYWLCSGWGGFYCRIWARGDDLVGACCNGTVARGCTCSDLTFSDCTAAEGGWAGPGTACASMMPQCGKGACCYGSGSCVDDVMEAECYAPPYNGDVFELGKSCAFMVPHCGKGACCYSGGSCVDDVTEAECYAPPFNGYAFELAKSCASLMPHCGRGACCYGSGACVEDVTEAECTTTYGGYGHKLGKPCAEVDCAPPPVNDLCPNAIALSGTCDTEYFDSANATFAPGDPPSCIAPVETVNDIWYTYQIPPTFQGQSVDTAEVAITTLGSVYDTVIVVYAHKNGVGCGGVGAINCSDAGSATEVACNSDVVPAGLAEHSPVQQSYVKVVCDGVQGPLPGGCLLIRVGGLDVPGILPGGLGQLNIDFIPTSVSGQLQENAGTCCLFAGGCVVTPDPASCAGYWRPITDFYEGALPASEDKAPGCCHGNVAGSCVVGDYCGNPIELAGSNTAWAGSVWKLRYFHFETRAPMPGDPGWPGPDAHYAMTIDTCGSTFDTVLTIYKGPYSGVPLLETGDCDSAGIIATNDDCTVATVPGAEGKVTCLDTTTGESCLCLTVGADEDAFDLQLNNEYWIAVGMKDPRDPVLRAEGVDPVPNYPIDPAVTLNLHLTDTWTGCEPCVHDCCRGDMNGDNEVDGEDIQPFISALMSVPACASAQWCAADMNNDHYVNPADIEPFVLALAYGYGCDPLGLDGTNAVANYCQLPDRQGHGFQSVIAATSDSMTVYSSVADNFSSPFGGLVTTVCWRGIYCDFYAAVPCGPKDPGGESFTVTYFNDHLGEPGDVKFGPYSVTAVPMATGQVYDCGNGPMPEYQYTATHPSALVGPDECMWLQIVNTTDGGNCVWLRPTTAGGDGKSYQGGLTDWDLSFCVNVPIYADGCARP